MRTFCILGPIAAIRSPNVDSKVGTYIIEAGTIVFPNLYSMTQDPKFWGSDVTKFRPERFLCENGRSSQHDWWDFTFGRGAKIEA